MSKKLYIAYGSNLNLKQMKYRCPTAKLVGKGTIEITNCSSRVCLTVHTQQSHLALASQFPLLYGNFSREMKDCLTATRVIRHTTSNRNYL